ncbi:S-DNA-T family DNA segregation ATPase FtsK/SpoIIIE [Rhizobium leguminosarum]|uniref:FtsK/SpoIIIE domain-containing protein n=1 Tax=Rhizobium leguminosarum TaxID=384 RepID=UPI00160E9B34|nr:FtsK/SpoIIIE domain-containing protein [Rhizobium leguminosarum]MBB4388545.1 S-DNA-T family DNA segregation ATPase FtsK/SpoIIIE [Rhizobium leguminosarum]
MDIHELIGKVAGSILKEELGDTGGEAGTARFLLDGLSVPQTLAITRAVLADFFLSERVDIKLPRALFEGHALPNEILTDRNATFYRSADCDKAAFLITNASADEGQAEDMSLHEVTPIGAAQLIERLPAWVSSASAGLALTDDAKAWWERSLAGLSQVGSVALERFARYVVATREAVIDEGYPIIEALGYALPALQLPRDPAAFAGIKDKSRRHASAWKREYIGLRRKRHPYLLKQNPNQIVISESELRDAFEKARDVIPEIIHPVVELFIESRPAWNSSSEALANCLWEHVKPLFEGLAREKTNLGQDTQRFYAEGPRDLLSKEDDEYLELLARRKTTGSPEPEDIEFYESHRDEIREDRKLKSSWDKFIYGRPLETEDFLAGLAMMMDTLNARAMVGVARILTIRCDSLTKRDLRSLNTEAGQFFSLRYAGLQRLLGPDVIIEFGSLMDYPSVLRGWQDAKDKSAVNRSLAKAALQLKFQLELETTDFEGGTSTASAQLIWKYRPDVISSQLTDDWDRLCEHAFVALRSGREPGMAGRRPGSIDLSDVKTLVPAYDRDRGSLVPTYRRERDLRLNWKTNLKAAVDQELIDAVLAKTLSAAFEIFCEQYQNAIRAFRNEGASNPVCRDQATSYAELLDLVRTLAPGDRNKELLLRPLLELGQAPVGDGAAAAIVAPWHPLRLAAVWRKAHLVRQVVRKIIDVPGGLEGDTKLFFKDLAEDMRHVFYPEVVVSWSGRKPDLLSLADHQGDYSLHERPVLDGVGGGETNDDAKAGTTTLLDLTQRYLNLHPHERANMSLVLYNCDSARLPQQLVEGLGELNDDEDMRCQVMLRHTDGTRLRDIYRSILTSTSGSAEVLAASEITQDFMARLRISVIADQAPPPDPRDGRPYDIVFSQDVISRHASVEWYRESADPADIASLLPARWSRRRPGAMDDLKSSVYLCSPVQSREGWAYLAAATAFLKDAEDLPDGKRLLPVRQLDFRDDRTARIFEETHDLGAWVVNYDELLDRRQLQNQSVRVIRYKQSATQGRNTVISSRAPLTLLRAMVRRRLEELQLDLTGEEVNGLADRFIGDANDISGDIVLRAAKRGEAAGELIGIVLSRFLARQSLDENRLVGWYFLDDYASWLGAREETQADILALSPSIDAAGELSLRIIVTEAKYVDAISFAPKRKESEKQLRDTMRRIIDAMAEPDRLDRESWLSRLGDLLLDGIQIPAASSVPLVEWRRLVRDGRARIEVVGFSHVFVPTALDGANVTDFSEVSGAPASRQMIFGRAELKALIMAYLTNVKVDGLLTSIDPIYGKVPEPHTPGTAPGPSVKVSHSSTKSKSGPAAEVDDRRHTVPPPAVDEQTGSRRPELEENFATSSARTVADIVAQHLDEGPIQTEADEEWLAGTAMMARSALQQLGLQAKLIDQKLTPNAAILRFSGSANLTVEQVLKRRSELLTTHRLDIISIRPEPGAIAIYVARTQRQVVDIQNLWSRWKPTVSPTGNQNLVIGIREDNNELFVLSPSQRHAPHTLIAGSTGSGKSVLMQSIILGIAATNDPRHARIVLIDPKQGVDYFAFDALPHLEGGIIDQQETAIDQLEHMVLEMDRRYRLFKEARVANITAYNAVAKPADVLPTYWVIHDEFAEWMLTDDYRAAVTSTVGRLGVKARAAGIHLIFAAQRPEANVMPMQLRSQLGNRLILRVDSEGTSEISLGEKGAERLLGKGHMIVRAEGEQGLIYAQVPLASETFITDVVESIMCNQPADALGRSDKSN